MSPVELRALNHEYRVLVRTEWLAHWHACCRDRPELCAEGARLAGLVLEGMSGESLLCRVRP